MARKCLLLTISLLLMFFLSLSWAEDRLIVKDGGGTQKFTVTDQGWVGINTTTPQAEIDLGGGAITLNGGDLSGYNNLPPQLNQRETGWIEFGWGGHGGGNLEAYSKGHASRQGSFYFVYGGGDFGDVRYYHFDGSSWTPTMTLDKNGRLDMGNGAYCDGRYWVDGSSRDYKENIQDLSSVDALQALRELKPVSYNYKTDKKDPKLGFIAEDVPDIVATKDRKGTNAMDFVAVLTKVVQEQQKQIDALKDKLNKLK